MASSIAIGGIPTKSVAGTNLTATHWTRLTNWARQEWRFLTGGVGTGIALGGTVWLVLAMQAPSAPLVADLASDAQPPVTTAPASAPLATAAPLAAEALVVPTAAVEDANSNKELPESITDKLAVEPLDPIASTAPIATAALDKPAPLDKPETAQTPQVKVPPAATHEKTPPVASAPRPTIKLEPVPATSPAATLPAEAASILDTDAADASSETPAVVRTPAAESPGAERPALTAADVDERLSRALPAAQFNKVPLFQFVEFVAEFTTLPIQLDEPALKRAGKSRQSAVTIKVNETTAGDALRAALSELGLVTTLRSGTLVVTVAPEANSAK